MLTVSIFSVIAFLILAEASEPFFPAYGDLLHLRKSNPLLAEARLLNLTKRNGPHQNVCPLGKTGQKNDLYLFINSRFAMSVTFSIKNKERMDHRPGTPACCWNKCRKKRASKKLQDCLPLSDVVISGVPGDKFKVPVKLIRDGAVCINFSSEKVRNLKTIQASQTLT